MFGVDWSDPGTMWINITNLAMGIFVLLAVLGVAFALVGDLRDKMKAKARGRALASLGSHGFFEPELGVTMADGGEPEKPRKSDQEAH